MLRINDLVVKYQWIFGYLYLFSLTKGLDIEGFASHTPTTVEPRCFHCVGL